MSNYSFPDQEAFTKLVYYFEGLCAYKGDGLLAGVIQDWFSSPDPDDKTTVFDYIDEEWLTLVHQKIKAVMSSDLYRGDGSFEHRLAYLCVTINLAHSFANGNKRSSLLVLLMLSFFADPSGLFVSVAKKQKEMYKTAKAIARLGESARDDNIVKLRELLKS